MIQKYEISGLCCPNCAAKIEANIAKLDGVNEASINYIGMKILLDFDESKKDEILKATQNIMNKIEPGMSIKF
ncbi:cation transporter [Campylobacter sp. RM13119]|uniref:Cation transporter n=1 Tax=Campylobacter californiensis TaxID=1032243 RepID=A0ABD4JJR0_9BACT|nr:MULTISPECIES: cation transporter [unclassified Campylobacter]MBE2986892.1 cation transporter [Campylobacter sp. RM12919]MBE2988549.1 cation transporter [Campylobacter sp. RM12920]MBE3022745.1 cation transporter [Campylobacter sp. 7477a]MBE3606846.1 cation transporter [Campylobacter sp. RM13119]MBE3610448.1 cation transporter [Campylobacter sp. RM12916]